MAQTIKLRRSATQGGTPTVSQLSLGEVAINTYDGKMYIKKDSGTASIVEVGGGNLPLTGGSLSGTLTVAGLLSVTNNPIKITASAPELIFSVPGGGLDSRIHNDGSGNFIFGTGANSNTPTERMRIDASGRVGINNTSPSSQYFNNLVVGDNSAGDKGITIRANSANKGVLAFSDTDSADANRYTGYIAYQHTDNSMRFHTNGGGERMRIDSLGNASFNTTNISPSANNVIGTALLQYGGASMSRTNSVTLDLNRSSSDGDIVYFRRDGTRIGTMTAASGKLQLIGENQNLGLGSGGVIRINLDNSHFYPQTHNATDLGFNAAKAFRNLFLSGTANVGGLTVNSAFTLPTADGSANQLLQTDGSGNVSWATVSGSGSTTSISDADNNTKIQVEESADENKIRFDTAGTQRMLLDNTGKLAVGGNQDPVYPLDLRNPSDSNQIFRVYFPDSSTVQIGTSRMAAGNTQGLFVEAQTLIKFGISGAEKMRLTAAGNLGIGTSTPFTTGGASKLTVAGILAIGASNADMSYIRRIGTGQYQWQTYNNGNTGDIQLQPYGGNVGIGTTSPQAKLDIKIATQGTAASVVAAGTSAGIYLEDDASPTDNYFVSKIHTPGNDTAIGGIKFAVSPDGSNYSWAGIKGLTSNSGNAGNLAFYTSASNTSGDSSTERMRITAAGNVGIGTTNPTSHINTGSFFKPDSNGKLLTLNGGANGSFIMLESSTTTDNDQIGGIYWSRTQGQGDAHKQVAGIDVIQAAYAPNNTLEGGTLRFFTKGSGSGTNTSRMVINPDGNVGIGTDSPGHLLHVTGAAGSIANMVVNNDNVALRMSAYTNSHGEIRVETNHPLVFKTNGNNERMRITAAGAVSIGTTTAAGAGGLLVDNDIKTNSRFGVGSGGTLSTAAIYKNSDANTGIYWPANNEIALTSAGAERLRITAAGNVGIGTSTPDAWLQIEKDNNNSGNQFSVADTEGASAAIRTYTHNGDPAGLILNHYYARAGSGYEYMRYADIVANVGNGAGTTMRFITKNAANTFSTTVIDNNGNVGIGTIAPAKTLDVAANGASQGIHLNISGVGRLQMYADGTRNYFKGLSGNGHRFTTTGGANVEILNNGRVGIGTTSPAAKLQVEVLGIDTTTTSTTAVTQVAIDSMVAATFRSARYTIQVTNSTDGTYHLTEMLLIHNGTTPSINEFGTIYTGSAAEAVFTADINSGNVRILATPASTDAMAFKVIRHSITV